MRSGLRGLPARKETRRFSAAVASPLSTSRRRASISCRWASETKDPKRTSLGMKKRETIATIAIPHGHSRAARASQGLTPFPLSPSADAVLALGLLRGRLVFLPQDLHHFAEATVAVQELDLLEPVEHVLRIETVTRRGPLLLHD